jgi:serine/threonine protein kinase
MDTAIFETFGKYKLTERLAFGGMAEVFLATVHGEAGFIKPVVIKRLHPRLNEDMEFVQMLIDEARITAQLAHTNICQVLDLGSVDNSYYLAMEFISGEDVRTLQDHCIRAGHELPVEIAVYIVTEVLAGLDYAHRKEDSSGQRMGIIHRDISPQNILISYEGEVKIIDFGIAKARMRMVQTEAGVIKGKFRYMSPEQASGGKIDHRTDVFAAGVVLYELLRGEPHSLDVPDTEVLRRMRRAEFEPLRSYRPSVPVTLEKLIKKALAVRPSGRYATAGAFRDALLGFLEKEGGRFGRNQLASAMRDLFDADRRRRRSGSFSGVEMQAPVLLPRRPEQGTHQVEPGPQAHVPTISQPRNAVAEARSDGWVAFAPTRTPDHDREQPPDTGELPPTNPLEALPTAAIDALPTDEQEMPPMERSVPASSASFPGDDEATQAWYSLSGRDTVDDGHSVPTAQRSGPVLPPGIRPPPPRGRPPEQDLHGQPTDIVRQDDEAPTRAAPDAHQRPPTLDEPTRAAEDPLAAPTMSTGFFANQAQTVIGAGGAPPSEPARRPRPPLRTLVGIGAVVLAGLILAVTLVLIDRPLDIEEDPQAVAVQADYGLRLGVPDQGDPGQQVNTTIHVQSQPAGAAIFLCGRDTGLVTPAEVPARAGDVCQLELELDGYDSYSMPVTAQAGRPITIVAALRRRTKGSRRRHRRHHRGKSPSPRALGGKGILRVTSIQVGTVYVNNKPAGTTPRLDVPLMPGTYLIKVYFANLGRYSGTKRVTVQGGETSRIHVEP